ncbi:hypothetical protein B0H13DRAFT_1852407 [Mycena leptocephala]|nr:hypothetical protein B0H13DRAFT_1852407 [Mycena leptocephala]
MATTAVIGFTTGTTAVVGFTTEHYKPLQQKSGFADVHSGPPSRMLYGFELKPEYFGPGQITLRYYGGTTSVFDRPDTLVRAQYIFDLRVVILRMGLGRSVSVLRPNYLSLMAERENGVRSLLNYDNGIPSHTKIRELFDTLHLLNEPEWIDTSAWITPPYRHNRSRIILNDSYWTFQWAREEGVPDSMEGILYLVADSVVRIALISPQNIQDWTPIDAEDDLERSMA